jgi:hypothetical protein
MDITKTLIIHSKNRTSGTPSNFDYSLGTNDMKGYRIKFLKAEITNTIYNITGNNNLLLYNLGDENDPPGG